MGAIWVGHHESLDLPVAVKLVHAELSGSDVAERLLAEARIVARLDHPAVVRVLDCGRTNHDDPFVVMELLTGECLSDRLDRVSRLEPIEAVEILLPIVDALRLVHESGVVHRDIKPDNIYLANTPAGGVQPKLIDFGIALSDFAGVVATHGGVVGSPAYMSPEQALGKANVGYASDVWAVCVALIETLTGNVPFESDDYDATLQAIVYDECPSLEVMGIADPGLRSIIERGLVKDPEARWPSAQALGVALAQWLFDHGVTEDAARVSLRAAWLGRKATSSFPPVTASVAPSVRPPKPTQERRSPRSVDRPALPTAHAAVPNPRSTARSPLLIAAVLISAAVLGFVVFRSPSSAPATPAAAAPDLNTSQARRTDIVRAPAGPATFAAKPVAKGESAPTPAAAAPTDPKQKFETPRGAPAKPRPKSRAVPPKNTPRLETTAEPVEATAPEEAPPDPTPAQASESAPGDRPVYRPALP